MLSLCMDWFDMMPTSSTAMGCPLEVPCCAILVVFVNRLKGGNCTTCALAAMGRMVSGAVKRRCLVIEAALISSLEAATKAWFTGTPSRRTVPHLNMLALARVGLHARRNGIITSL